MGPPILYPNSGSDVASYLFLNDGFGMLIQGPDGALPDKHDAQGQARFG